MNAREDCDGCEEERERKLLDLPIDELALELWKSALLVGQHWAAQDGINAGHLDRHAELVRVYLERREAETAAKLGSR